MARISVRPRYGQALDVSIRGHRLVADQPRTHGGEDSGATPTELFAASLAACVAHYAATYLRNHGLPAVGLVVDADFSWDQGRADRIAAIDVRVTPPAGLSEDRVRAMLRAAQHCAVHQSLKNAPEVQIAIPALERAS